MRAAGRRVRQHRVRCGGQPKEVLLARLAAASVQLNDYGRQLLASDRFSPSLDPSEATLVEVSVADLGFPEGAVMADLVHRAKEIGLGVCPLETAVALRLQYLDQPEGEESLPHRAPAGSLTVVSEPLSAEEDVPHGFYLRRREGVLWLRGYVSGPDHRWDPQDRLVFLASEL